MATTKTTRIVKKTTKSDRARDALKEGRTIRDIADDPKFKMGYPFVYGVAKRLPHPDGGTYADRAADRRASKVVTTSGDEVTVRTDVGTLTVNLRTGKRTFRAIKA